MEESALGVKSNKKGEIEMDVSTNEEMKEEKQVVKKKKFKVLKVFKVFKIFKFFWKWFKKFKWGEFFKLLPSYLTVGVAAMGIWWGVDHITENINKQTQVVIEPREGDIIVKEDGSYKLLQLINYEDISFPNKIQEVKIKSSESVADSRVEINNFDGADWSKKDSFKYVIDSFSVNPNKAINLLDNIENITVYCDFYTEKNISKYVPLGTKVFQFEIWNSSWVDEDFNVTITNKQSDNEYVTNELNNGIEWVKIRVKIVYKIGDKKITDDIVSDWIATDADLV